mmetsp:Transcript_54700/g.97314  ORF Transcript_54700/g.97314 Transcript_54700/m.97314 type:complete len:81 (-) Transcript_54700:1142-1384(-)
MAAPFGIEKPHVHGVGTQEAGCPGALVPLSGYPSLDSTDSTDSTGGNSRHAAGYDVQGNKCARALDVVIIVHTTACGAAC